MLAGGNAAEMAELSAVMRGAWIAFIRSGRPGHEALPPWPPYEVIRRPTMRFGARVGTVGDPTGLGYGE